MVIAVVAVGMMEVPIDEVIHVVTVRDGLMPAVRPMNMAALMPVAAVVGGAVRWIHLVNRHHVFVHMPLMWMMHVDPPGQGGGIEGGEGVWRSLGFSAPQHLTAIATGFARAMAGEAISAKGETAEETQARHAKQRADIKKKSEYEHKMNELEYGRAEYPSLEKS